MEKKTNLEREKRTVGEKGMVDEQAQERRLLFRETAETLGMMR